MKRFIYTVIASAAVALSVSSCTEDGFLKEEMVATITQQYYETETGLDALVTGLYDHLRIIWMRQNYSAQLWSTNNDTGSISEYLPSNYSQSGSSKLGGFIMHYQNNPYYQRWGAYAAYNEALYIIDLIDNSADKIGGQYKDAAYCAQQKSVAYFAKDYLLYVLASMMGDVYIPTEATHFDNGVYYAPRSASKDVWDMFISDMKYAYEHLPSASAYSGSIRNERITKGAAAQFLTRLYLDRALGNKFAGLRNQDGSFKQGENEALGMLYKGGNYTEDLNSVIEWANKIINSGEYALEDDYSTFGRKVSGDFSDEASLEIIWSMAADEAYAGEKNNNGAWGWRTEDYYGRYTSSWWGTNSRAWVYGSHKGYEGMTDWAFDVFTDKFNDSRFAKSYFLELYPYGAPAAGGVDTPFTSYMSAGNSGAKWMSNFNPYKVGSATKYADWFNENKATWFGADSPYAQRATAVISGADYKTSSDWKITDGEISLVMLVNDREHAIDADLCHSMPFVVCPRWSYYVDQNGDKHYYTNQASYQAMTNDPIASSVDKGFTTSGYPWLTKYTDPNRNAINSETAGRNVNCFRLADTYLMRAWAEGLLHNWDAAIDDINVIRRRAGYNAGELRPMAVAQFADYYDGGDALAQSEREYPYAVAASTKSAMEVSAAYWTPGTPEFEAENYPHFISASFLDDKRNPISVTDNNAGFTDATDFYFSNFMVNEYSREFMGENIMMFVQQYSGLRYTRLLWHNQKASTITKDENGNNIWPEAAENSRPSLYQDGTARGSIRPYMIWEPIVNSYLDNLTDADGKPLDQAGKAAYQNPGYVQ